LREGAQSGAVDVGRGVLAHPLGEIANAQALNGSGGIEVELAGDAVGVAAVGAADGIEDEEGIFD